jgi:hypothetical protein
MSRELRRLFLQEEPSAEPGRYGCPMLSRGHRPHPIDPNRPLMRCSIGWAIHDDEDVQRCLATEAVTDCWKVHPERMPIAVLAPAAPAPAPGLAPEFREVSEAASAD